MLSPYKVVAFYLLSFLLFNFLQESLGCSRKKHSSNAPKGRTIMISAPPPPPLPPPPPPPPQSPPPPTPPNPAPKGRSMGNPKTTPKPKGRGMGKVGKGFLRPIPKNQTMIVLAVEDSTTLTPLLKGRGLKMNDKPKTSRPLPTPSPRFEDSGPSVFDNGVNELDYSQVSKESNDHSQIDDPALNIKYVSLDGAGEGYEGDEYANSSGSDPSNSEAMIEFDTTPIPNSEETPTSAKAKPKGRGFTSIGQNTGQEKDENRRKHSHGRKSKSRSHRPGHSPENFDYDTSASSDEGEGETNNNFAIIHSKDTKSRIYDEGDAIVHAKDTKSRTYTDHGDAIIHSKKKSSLYHIQDV